MRDLFLIIAAIGEHEDIPRIMGANVLASVSLIDVRNDAVMFGVIGERMFSTIPLAIQGNGREGNQDVIDDQDDIGPRMPDDTPCAMMEFLGVFRVHTGTMLQGTLNQQRNLPRQLMLGEVVERLGQSLRLLCGEVLECRDGDWGVGGQKLTELGCVSSRKTGGFFKGMFPGHDHQKKERADANRGETGADRDVTGDPGVQSASLHGASSL